jgi:hypothetical protein
MKKIFVIFLFIAIIGSAVGAPSGGSDYEQIEPKVLLECVGKGTYYCMNLCQSMGLPGGWCNAFMDYCECLKPTKAY